MSLSCLLLLKSQMHYERSKINKKYHTARNVQKSNRKNRRKKGKIDTPNTQINHRCFPGFVQELQSKVAGLH